MSSFADKYQILCQFSSGSYGRIHVVRDIGTSKDYAAKEIASEEEGDMNETTAREYSTLKLLGGQCGVLEIVDAYFEEDCQWMIFELQDENFLSTIRETMHWTAHRARHYMLQLLCTLDYIHSNRIMHRDIKPTNILRNVKEDKLYIIDFGLAQRIGQQTEGIYFADVVSMFYRAPELLETTATATVYGPSVDIWALGCVFAEMLHGTPLFNSTSRSIQLANTTNISPQLLKNITNANCRDWDKTDRRRFRNLVASMWTVDAQKRPTTRKLLEHPFFQVSTLLPALLSCETPVTALPWKGNNVETSRPILCEWIFRTNNRFKLSLTTFCRTLHIIDSFLAQESVETTDLQAVATVASMLAAKLEDYRVPSLKCYMEATAYQYKSRHLCNIERQMLKNICLTTPLLTDYMQSPTHVFEYLAYSILCYGYSALLTTQCTAKQLFAALSRMARDIITAPSTIYTALELQIQAIVSKHTDSAISDEFPEMATLFRDAYTTTP